MVGTELAMELGGATIPEPCRGGSGGGGPGRRHHTPEVTFNSLKYCDFFIFFTIFFSSTL